jgi:hypothetical protein
MPMPASCVQGVGMPVKQGFASPAGGAKCQRARDKRAVIVQADAFPAHDWCAPTGSNDPADCAIAYALATALTGRDE